MLRKALRNSCNPSLHQHAPYTLHPKPSTKPNKPKKQKKQKSAEIIVFFAFFGVFVFLVLGFQGSVNFNSIYLGLKVIP